MNKIELMGRLTREPEIKPTQNSTLTKFSIAVGSGYGEHKKTDFFNCVAFSKTAETIGQYFKKGDPILLDGSAHIRSWEMKRKGGAMTSYIDSLSKTTCFMMKAWMMICLPCSGCFIKVVYIRRGLEVVEGGASVEVGAEH